MPSKHCSLFSVARLGSQSGDISSVRCGKYISVQLFDEDVFLMLTHSLLSVGKSGHGSGSCF